MDCSALLSKSPFDMYHWFPINRMMCMIFDGVLHLLACAKQRCWMLKKKVLVLESFCFLFFVFVFFRLSSFRAFEEHDKKFLTINPLFTFVRWIFPVGKIFFQKSDSKWLDTLAKQCIANVSILTWCNGTFQSGPKWWTDHWLTWFKDLSSVAFT